MVKVGIIKNNFQTSDDYYFETGVLSQEWWRI
jgi:hypothetical protein